VYQVEMQGGFRSGNRWGADFVTLRLATGAQFAQGMIYDAWMASANGMVGYPMVNVCDIESGHVPATRELMGAD
jgi:hypothetical protein